MPARNPVYHRQFILSKLTRVVPASNTSWCLNSCVCLRPQRTFPALASRRQNVERTTTEQSLKLQAVAAFSSHSPLPINWVLSRLSASCLSLLLPATSLSDHTSSAGSSPSLSGTPTLPDTAVSDWGISPPTSQSILVLSQSWIFEGGSHDQYGSMPHLEGR